MSSQQKWAITQSLATVAEPGTHCCDQCLWPVPWAERPFLVTEMWGMLSPPPRFGVRDAIGGCAMPPGCNSACTWGCQETLSGMFPVCELLVVFVACDLCRAEFGWKLGFG